MNTYNLSLSCNTTSTISNLPLIDIEDHTKLFMDVAGITEIYIPIYLKIDWGDGTIENYNSNDIYDPMGGFNSLKISPILSKIYEHEYTPSDSCLFKSLTAQLIVEFADGNFSWFIQPIEIRNLGYFETIPNLKLENLNILPVEDNYKEYQFRTDDEGYLIELRNG